MTPELGRKLLSTIDILEGLGIEAFDAVCLD